MKSVSTLQLPPVEPRQLNMALDAPKLRGLSPSERDVVLGALAGLLLEATGILEREDDDAYV